MAIRAFGQSDEIPLRSLRNTFMKMDHVSKVFRRAFNNGIQKTLKDNLRSFKCPKTIRIRNLIRPCESLLRPNSIDAMFKALANTMSSKTLKKQKTVSVFQ